MKLVAIGFVVLLFVAAFAGYWSMEAMKPTSTTTSPLFTYVQSGRYSYVAALSNNTLYNTSTLTPGNGTLFTEITTWVNLTYTYRLTVSRAVDAGVDVLLAVAVETPAWSKSMGSVSGTTYIVDGTSGAVTLSFDLSVANVSALVTAIEKQTGYSPSSYSVVLTPSVAASVVLASNGTGLTYVSPLTLNFSAGQITPTHLFSSAYGAYSPGGGDPPASAPLPWLPLSILAVSLAGAAWLGYLTYRTYRRDGGPDLEAITRPFKEAIVDTSTPPPAASRVDVPSWTDLVKVADTLGCPILRVRSGGRGADSGALFYVLSDGLAYVYRYGTAVVPRSLSPSATAGGPSGATTVASSSATPASTTAARPPNGPTAPVARAWSLEAFVRSAEGVQRTISTLGSDPATAGESERLLVRSIELARRGRLDAAWLTLEGARFRADSARSAGLPSPPRPAAPGPRRPGM